MKIQVLPAPAGQPPAPAQAWLFCHSEADSVPVSATRSGVPQATVIMSESLDVLNFAWTVTRPGRLAAGSGTPASQAGTCIQVLNLYYACFFRAKDVLEL